MRKKLLLIGGILFVILLSGFIYWYYNSEPSSVPTQSELIEQMNKAYGETVVASIQDTILVDQRHLYVPFISEDNNYGTSFFVWKERKWQIEALNSTGHPILWKVNPKDPSTYQLVWNLHPEDHLESVKYYLMRDRGYEISDGIEFYYPGVQLIKEVPAAQKSYGLLELPEDWVSIINFSNNRRSPVNHDYLFLDLNAENNLSFVWDPIFKKEDGQDIYTKRSIGGGGFSNGENYEPLRMIDELELESQEDF